MIIEQTLSPLIIIETDGIFESKISFFFPYIYQEEREKIYMKLVFKVPFSRSQDETYSTNIASLQICQ